MRRTLISISCQTCYENVKVGRTILTDRRQRDEWITYTMLDALAVLPLPIDWTMFISSESFWG